MFHFPASLSLFMKRSTAVAEKGCSESRLNAGVDPGLHTLAPLLARQGRGSVGDRAELEPPGLPWRCPHVHRPDPVSSAVALLSAYDEVIVRRRRFCLELDRVHLAAGSLGPQFLHL